MEHQLFIAINLPEHIKEVISNAVEQDRGISPVYGDARLVAKEDWHITIKFLGKQAEKSIDVIEKVMRDVVAETTSPEISMRTLTTAPPHRPPHMIWMPTTAETNQTLGVLKTAIEQKLAMQGIVQKGELFPTYHGHITLARLPEGRKIDNHAVVLSRAITFRPVAMDIMESRLESSEAKYSVLKSIDFKRSI